MNCGSACMECLLKNAYKAIKTKDDEKLKKRFMSGALKILGDSKFEKTAPYLLYKLTNLYEEVFDETIDYTQIKHDFNKLVLDREKDIEKMISSSPDPLKASIAFSRIGNYIDFGAMENVSKEDFLALFDNEKLNHVDEDTYNRFIEDCSKSKTLLLTADNCGEIVLDRIMTQQLMKQFPHLEITLMVKGKDISNDATMVDAKEAGFEGLVKIITSGNGIPGSDPAYLSDEAKDLLDSSDIILSKGQANFETLSLYGKNTYYSFLCKCDYFAEKFNVPKLTGMFINESDLDQYFLND